MLLEVYDAVRNKNRELDLQLNMEPVIGPQTAIPRKSKLEKRRERVLEKSPGISKNDGNVKVISHVLSKFKFDGKPFVLNMSVTWSSVWNLIQCIQRENEYDRTVTLC